MATDSHILAALKGAEKLNDELRAKVSELTAASDAKHARATALTADLDAKNAEIASLRAELGGVRNSTHVERTEQSNKHASEVRNLETQVKNLKKQLDDALSSAKSTPSAEKSAEVALAAKDRQIAELTRVQNALRSEVRTERDNSAVLLKRIDAEEASRRRLQDKLDAALNENDAALQSAQRVAQSQLDNLRKQLQDAHAGRLQSDDLRAQQARNHQATNSAHDGQIASLKDQVEKLSRDLRAATNQLEVERAATKAAKAETEQVRVSQKDYVDGLNKRWTASQTEKQDALAKADGSRRHVASLLTKVSDLETRLRDAQDLHARSSVGNVSRDASKLDELRKDLDRKVQEVRTVQAEYTEFKRNALDADKKRMETIAKERQATVDEKRRADDAEARLSRLEAERALA